MLTLNDADKLLMIPGPTPVQREILSALGEPTIPHTSDTMADIIRRCLDGLREIAGSETSRAFVFSGSGTLAQEAAVINLVQPGEKLVVASNGFFGDRFVPLAKAHGIEPVHLVAPWGKSVTPAQLEETLAEGGARAVTITHVETSTGVMSPVSELAEVARQYGAFVILDAVCSLGGVPISMDDLEIDMVLSGAQKALGVPPGLTILAASQRAMERRRSLSRIGGYYTDLLNWEDSMADPRTYFSTHGVNMFYALHASIEIIAREGLSARFARHERLAGAFRAGASALGFTSLTDDRYLAPTLSVLAYPPGASNDSFPALLQEHGVIPAVCLGEFKGRGLRFGHMGNISETEILQALSAMEQTLAELGTLPAPGSGVGTAQSFLSAFTRSPVGA